MHYRDPSCPMPQFLHNVLILKLGKLFGMTNTTSNELDSHAESREMLVQKSTYPKSNERKEKHLQYEVESNAKSASPAHQTAALDAIAADVRMMANAKMEGAKEEERSKQWQLAARVIDRLFLYVHMVVIFVTSASLVIIYPLTLE